jgi:hypothetical protein
MGVRLLFHLPGEKVRMRANVKHKLKPSHAFGTLSQPMGEG